MKPTLLVLAAGMGSRYGGLKQMDAFGPNGETIIDYSIYDAVNAGFGKVVFVIREHFKIAFEAFFEGKFDGKIEVQYVTQELTKIPDGYKYNKDREKPWGTAHAVWMGASAIDGPFAVINADDYYGVDAYKVIVDFFNSENTYGPNDYAVVGYKLKNTLSDHGVVNRGVCFSDENQFLERVEECVKIERLSNGRIQYPSSNGVQKYLELDTLVSMNMWGFKPSYFDFTETYFKEFLKERGMELKSEFYIPAVVDALINEYKCQVKVLVSDSEWFGVTYQEDKPIVTEKLDNLIELGVYPKKLW